MTLAASIWTQSWFILILIVGIFGLLTLAIFLIRKFVINKNKQDEAPTEEKAAEETVDRFLEEVEDPETLKEFDEYEQKSK